MLHIDKELFVFVTLIKTLIYYCYSFLTDFGHYNAIINIKYFQNYANSTLAAIKKKMKCIVSRKKIYFGVQSPELQRWLQSAPKATRSLSIHQCNVLVMLFAVILEKGNGDDYRDALPTLWYSLQNNTMITVGRLSRHLHSGRDEKKAPTPAATRGE